MDVYPMIDGLLWQSSMPDHPAWEHAVNLDVDLDGSMDVGYPAHEQVYVAWPIDDADYLPDAAHLDWVGKLVADSVRHKQPTLVHCAAGINRASLVNGVALHKLGYRHVVDRIRSRRPGALSNQTFVDYLNSLEPS